MPFFHKPEFNTSHIVLCTPPKLPPTIFDSCCCSQNCKVLAIANGSNKSCLTPTTMARITSVLLDFHLITVAWWYRCRPIGTHSHPKRSYQLTQAMNESQTLITPPPPTNLQHRTPPQTTLLFVNTLVSVKQPPSNNDYAQTETLTTTI